MSPIDNSKKKGKNDMNNFLQKDTEIIKALLEKQFSENNIQSIERLGGLTNRSYHVVLSDREIVFRIPGEGTEELIDRHDERTSNVLACKVDVDTELLYFDADSGIKVCNYIKDAKTMSPETMRQKENMIQAANLLQHLHSCGEDTGVSFEVFQMAENYEKLIYNTGGTFYPDYDKIRSCIMRLKHEIDKDESIVVPCHNDPLCENWVRGNSRMYLVDWEYAGMNDPMWDLADVSIEADYDNDMDKDFLMAYFGRQATEKECRRFSANKIYLDFLWCLWGKTRVPFDGEIMERYERLKRNLSYLDA